MTTPTEHFLQVKNLKTHFPIYEGLFFQKIKGNVRAVDGVSFNLKKGEVLGLVGESGCGKSTLGRSIMQLVRITEGEVILEGRQLNALTPKELNRARLDFQMIFQDPYASLDPRMTVFDTLAEPLLYHGIVPKKEVEEEVSRLMSEVGLAPRYMKKYPHEFSGGQRQRIAVARALAVRPKLIIADEPVSALDVSIQSQVLNLLASLTKKYNLSMIFISHDLSVIKHISDRMAVMYLGRIVELGDADAIFNNPSHPYTKALLSAIPLPDPNRERARERILLEGDPPSPINPPAGCRFHPRCPWMIEDCKKGEPELEKIESVDTFPQHVACIRKAEI